MNNEKYVYSQFLDFLDRNHFNYLVRKYEGDKYVKNFTCYNQLAVLMFGQLSNRESLMMAIVQKNMGIDIPIYEMLLHVSVLLTEKTPLDKLFGKPNYNIVNDLDGSSEPSLF